MKAKIFLLMLVGFFFILVFSSLINGSVCTGTFSCDVFGSPNICNLNSGCSWMGGLGPCAGNSPCSQFVSESTCGARSGCSWVVFNFDSRDNVNDYLEVEWETGGGQPPTQTCSDDSDCSQGQECTEGVCVTSTPPIIPNFCSQYTICSNYLTQNDCTQNLCQLNSQTPTLTCPSDASCGCSWNSATNSCGSSFISTDINGNLLGTCTFQEDTTDDCSDGFLEYSIKAKWEGTGTPPLPAPQNCIDGTVSPIICSAKTKLPLESKFGILLTILVIVLGYLFFRGNKKRKNL